MDLSLKGKTTMVTGGGQGVGRGICLELAAEGVNVVVNDLFAERAEAVVAEIEAAGGSAMAGAGDVTDVATIGTIVAAANARFGTIDILVNNAGILPERREQGGVPPAFKDTTPDDWRKIVDLNVHGTLTCTAAVLPGMVAQRSGKIISIISEAARLGEARFAAYAGAKAAIQAFSKSLAREHGRDRINVNCIALAAVAHEGWRDGPLKLGQTPENNEILGKMLKLYPIGQGLGRAAVPGDVSGVVAFLASPRAEYMTGQTIGVNGGFAML